MIQSKHDKKFPTVPPLGPLRHLRGGALWRIGGWLHQQPRAPVGHRYRPTDGAELRGFPKGVWPWIQWIPWWSLMGDVSWVIVFICFYMFLYVFICFYKFLYVFICFYMFLVYFPIRIPKWEEINRIHWPNHEGLQVRSSISTHANFDIYDLAPVRWTKSLKSMWFLPGFLPSIPVVLHKAVAEVSKIGNL